MKDHLPNIRAILMCHENAEKVISDYVKTTELSSYFNGFKVGMVIGAILTIGGWWLLK